MDITIIEAAMLMLCCVGIGFFMGRSFEIERDTDLKDEIKPKDRHTRTKQTWMDATRKHKDV